MIASTESRSESESSITIRGERVLQQTASVCREGKPVPTFPIMLDGILFMEWCFHYATAQRAYQDTGFNVSNRGYERGPDLCQISADRSQPVSFHHRLAAVSVWRCQAPEISRRESLRKSRVVLSDRRGRRARTGARRVADDRLVFAHRCLHPVGRNGICLFHRTLSAQLLSALQQRHRGDPVLLCLPVSGDVRRRPG